MVLAAIVSALFVRSHVDSQPGMEVVRGH
jgi:hypothetical protein